MTLVGQAEPQRWSAGRWWGVITVVFCGQLALIFWLSDRTPLRPRPAAPAPILRLAGQASTGLLELSDPTLFALPHRHGFAGLAWLSAPPPELPGFSYTSAPEWLSLSLPRPGTAFNRFIQTNVFAVSQLPANPEPEAGRSEPVLLPPARERSEVRVEGELATRQRLTPVGLPSWPHTELLTNSVVQMVVDADGRPVSVVLLQTNGLREADLAALARARSARFAPLRGGGAGRTNRLADLSWGSLVFEWHTVSATNDAAGKP
jgi:hypothetical protein